jgi:hypothetical protein
VGGSSGVLRGQKPCDNFFVVKKLRRLLRLLRLLGQFGPDSLPVVREQLLPRYRQSRLRWLRRALQEPGGFHLPIG